MALVSISMSAAWCRHIPPSHATNRRSPMFVRSQNQSSLTTQLTCERLEDRTTPAQYFVALRSVITGEVGTTAATVSGSLDLNAAQPSVPGGILVTANSAIDAVRYG